VTTADPAHLGELLVALRESPLANLVVVTGAGVSLASGIPTFRGTDPGAIWHQETLELGTFSYFCRNPTRAWQWALDLFEPLSRARPNPGHYALAALERWQVSRGGRFLLVTQNVDSLHEQAGSRELAKVHGSADRYRCTREGCAYAAPAGSLCAADFDLTGFRRHPHHDRLPRCPACAALVRAHVLLFDELYNDHVDYQFERVMTEVEDLHLALFVGTSFSVGITDLILNSALARRRPAFSIDPAGVAPHPAVRTITACSEQILPIIAERLGTGTASIA
jgi:NAD-dependent deacetylase